MTNLYFEANSDTRAISLFSYLLQRLKEQLWSWIQLASEQLKYKAFN